MKIRPVGAELFHADRQTDRYDEVNSRFSQFYKGAKNSASRCQWHYKDSTGLSKKMDGIWNRYNLKSTGRIYTFGVLKCS